MSETAVTPVGIGDAPTNSQPVQPVTVTGQTSTAGEAGQRSQ